MRLWTSTTVGCLRTVTCASTTLVIWIVYCACWLQDSFEWRAPVTWFRLKKNFGVCLSVLTLVLGTPRRRVCSVKGAVFFWCKFWKLMLCILCWMRWGCKFIDTIVAFNGLCRYVIWATEILKIVSRWRSAHPIANKNHPVNIDQSQFPICVFFHMSYYY